MAEVDTLDVEDATQQVATVATLSKVIKTIGVPTDIKVTDADSTTATEIAVLKGILQKTSDGIVALGAAAASNSVPVVPATDGKFQVVSGGNEYKYISANATATTLGATGGVGDYLEGLLCIVSNAGTSQVSILDNATSMLVFPASVGAGIGSYYVPIGAYSTNGPWKVTTSAGVAVLATGDFT